MEYEYDKCVGQRGYYILQKRKVHNLGAQVISLDMCSVSKYCFQNTIGKDFNLLMKRGTYGWPEIAHLPTK